VANARASWGARPRARAGLNRSLGKSGCASRANASNDTPVSWAARHSSLVSACAWGRCMLAASAKLSASAWIRPRPPSNVAAIFAVSGDIDCVSDFACCNALAELSAICGRTIHSANQAAPSR